MVFGTQPHEALRLLADGRTKDEIREATGDVIGVQDASFALRLGEFFVIMGLSGSGKSTLLRCLNRLIAPTSGRVWLQTGDGEVDVARAEGRELRRLRQEHLAMVFQRFGLLPHRTVRDNVGGDLRPDPRGARLPRRAPDHVGQTIIPAGGSQGYLVTKAAAEEFGITSLDDFKRPEVNSAFDRTGDGKADLVACPPGWGCETVIEHHLDAYELRDHVNDIEAAYNPAFADALADYRSGKPVLSYTWTPNFTVFQMVPGVDSVWINVPEIVPNEAQEGFEEFMVIHGLEGGVTDPVLMGFVADDIQAVANNGFLEANPAAASILANVQIPVTDVSAMTLRISEGEDGDDAVAAMAAEGIAANRAQVDAWLADARSAHARTVAN